MGVCFNHTFISITAVAFNFFLMTALLDSESQSTLYEGKSDGKVAYFVWNINMLQYLTHGSVTDTYAKYIWTQSPYLLKHLS